MKLVRIAQRHWEVLAICDSRGMCLVMEFLGDLMGTTYQIAAEQMFRLLTIQTPANGPPKTEPLCKPLGDGLYEFRKRPRERSSALFGSTAAVRWSSAPSPLPRGSEHRGTRSRRRNSSGSAIAERRLPKRSRSSTSRRPRGRRIGSL